MTSLGDTTLAALRSRITRVLPMQVRAAVDALSDEQLWWRPNEKSNSVANLVLHIAGSLDHYLNRCIGGFAFTRDREGEFAARGPMTKDELLDRLDRMLDKAETTFDSLDEERLTGPSGDPERYSMLIEDLVNITTHFASHAGQIMWIAKMLQEGSLNETWMRSHKRGGAWK
jgi:uncharacterized damage-inducible protein DinB